MAKLFLFFTLLLSCGTSNAITPVEQHGFLKAKNSFIWDQNGNRFQLKGVSSHGLQWFGDDITYQSLKILRDDWGINVIRAAMYTAQDGYISNKNLKHKSFQIADWAIELGIYVIIDWHILYDNNPQTYQNESIKFFSEVAEKYAGKPNVIYELCNEPNGAVSWRYNIKPYAVTVTQSIRKFDAQNIVVVGSGTWSTDIQDPINDPIIDNNIAYSVHFYAGTANKSFLDKIDWGRGKGFVFLVTEWGVTDSSGNGAIYYDNAKWWITQLDIRKIGHVAWSYSRANETSGMLTNSGVISQSGRFVKSLLSGTNYID